MGRNPTDHSSARWMRAKFEQNFVDRRDLADVRGILRIPHRKENPTNAGGMREMQV